MLKAGKQQQEAQKAAEKTAERKEVGVAGHREDDFLKRARELEGA